MTTPTPPDPKPSTEKHPQVFRWNIGDDYYNDGLTVYADGSVHFNVGGNVIVKSIRGWFESEQELEKSRREVEELKKELISQLEVVRQAIIPDHAFCVVQDEDRRSQIAFLERQKNAYREVAYQNSYQGINLPNKDILKLVDDEARALWEKEK